MKKARLVVLACLGAMSGALVAENRQPQVETKRTDPENHRGTSAIGPAV